MGFALNHLFSENDARLDEVLVSVRRARREDEHKAMRDLSDKVVRLIEGQRSSGESFLALAPFDGFADTAYDQFMRSVRLARIRLNPIVEALEATKHALADRRTVRHWLWSYARLVPMSIADSALLVWLMTRTAWRKLLARLSTRITTRRSNGFFGAGKVDGRNTP